MNSRSAHRDAGPQRQRDAVAGRHRRVGGDREQLAGAAGRERSCRGAHGSRPARRRVERVHADAPAALDDELDREAPLAHLDQVERVHRGDERPLDLGAGRVAAGVHDARQRVAALARERSAAVAPSPVRSNTAPSAMSSRTRPGPFGDEHPHRVDVAQPGAGGERVGEVQLGRVGLVERGGDATLRVPGRRERRARPS